jgi:4-amino-4-deoxy-L-arabinose transferase-like glycosyltransferase
VSPAAPAFLILTIPWLVLAEKANPGFLQFFFVHEHFERFATPAASRPGPIYYFAGLFLAAFLPGLPFFFRGACEAFRRDPLSLFFGIWFAVVLVFFSVSRSKLPPYVFPALPAAAALAARGFAVFRATRAPWRWHAAIVAAFLAACAAIPDVRRAVSESGIVPLALAGALSLAAGAAAALGVRRAETATAAMGFGWAGLYLVLALAWPKLPLATDVAELAGAAGSASKDRGAAPIVGYRCYLQGFPWNLRATIPVADFKGELEDWWLPEGERREVFWSRGRFREEWSSGRSLVALVRERDRKDFERIEPPARFLLCRGKYCVAANW